MKNWQKSKTLLLSYVGLIVWVLADPAVVGIIPPEWSVKIIALQAILGAVLRFYTDKPLSLRSGTRTEPHQP